METRSLGSTLPTRLAPGSYCNIGRFQFTPAGGSSAATCSGAAIVVTANGDAALTVPAMTTLALHTGARLN